MGQHTPKGKSPATWCIVTALLGVAIVGTLWVPLYAHTRPRLGPFPFFYWFQLIWVPLTAAMCWICYLLLRRDQFSGPRSGPGQGVRR